MTCRWVLFQIPLTAHAWSGKAQAAGETQLLRRLLPSRLALIPGPVVLVVRESIIHTDRGSVECGEERSSTIKGSSIVVSRPCGDFISIFFPNFR